MSMKCEDKTPLKIIDGFIVLSKWKNIIKYNII